MLIVENKTISEIEFSQLLNKTRELCINRVAKDNIKKMSGIEFEALSYEMMCDAAVGTGFEKDIVRTGTFAFPDIVANKFYGAEVKVTDSDKWQSTGNSVLESTRISSVERIYLFFGKFGSNFDVKYRLYQECLYDISVTHMPRYKIDMDLGLKLSIFDKIGIDYDSLRKDETILKRIKEYYKKQLKEGEELWWLDSTSDNDVRPIIRNLSSYSLDEKRAFMVEVMILFPEIFGKSSLKFERVASYLVTGHNTVSSNIRDMFSAGGQTDILINGTVLSISKIISHLINNASQIKKTINIIDSEKLQYYWNVESISDDRLKQWGELISLQYQNNGYTAFDIFNSGLK